MGKSSLKIAPDFLIYTGTFSSATIAGNDSGTFSDSGSFPSGYRAVSLTKVTTGDKRIVVRGWDFGSRTLYLTNTSSSSLTAGPTAMFLCVRTAATRSSE